MIVAKRKPPRGSVGLDPTPSKCPKLINVKVEQAYDDDGSDQTDADSADDGVRISCDGKLYNVGSLHVAVLLESTTSHPCAEHK